MEILLALHPKVAGIIGMRYHTQGNFLSIPKQYPLLLPVSLGTGATFFESVSSVCKLPRVPRNQGRGWSEASLCYPIAQCPAVGVDRQEGLQCLRCHEAGQSSRPLH